MSTSLLKPAQEGPWLCIGKVLALGLLLTFVIPLLSFFVCGVRNGMGLGESAQALAVQLTQPRHNPALSAIPALLPLPALGIVLWVLSRYRPEANLLHYGVAALGGLALIQLWVNWSFWDIYLPQRVYPGFPHGLEFIIGPIFFSPLAMVLCLVGVALVARKR